LGKLHVQIKKRLQIELMLLPSVSTLLYHVIKKRICILQQEAREKAASERKRREEKERREREEAQKAAEKLEEVQRLQNEAAEKV